MTWMFEVKHEKFTRRIYDPTVKCPICEQVVSVPIRDDLECINLSYAIELIQDHIKNHSAKSISDYFETRMLNQLTPKLKEPVTVG